MALPKIDLPAYDFVIPSTGKTIKFRPFSVKEQKLLLMANESKDVNDIYNTVKQITQNCVLTKNFDVESFSCFDMECFFIQLRSKSIGEVISLNYMCNNEVEGQVCGAPLQFQYNLNDVKVDVPKKTNNKIFFTSTVGVIMKYPGIDIIKIAPTFLIDGKGSIGDIAFDLVATCVEYIFDGDKVYATKDIDKEELEEFIETISVTDYEKMIQWLSDMPTIKATVEHDCPKCGFHHSINVEGLASFFV